MAIESKFNVPFIAALALKEKQVQQNYRPIIAIHKWFARRPGTLFRGLILSEFSERPLEQAFFSANDFPNRVVADPFMGGGTPIIEANRVGCEVHGLDINPMATWIVREALEHLDLQKYRTTASRLIAALTKKIGKAYRTDCPHYGDKGVPVKYFLWVKVIECQECGRDVDLFPGYLLADDTRHPRNVLVCSECGELNETAILDDPGHCSACNAGLRIEGPARRSKCQCRHCGHNNSYPQLSVGPPRHRMFAIEYYNPNQREIHKGRFFKKPDQRDLERFAEAMKLWRAVQPSFVPDDPIPSGDETNRLHRWGYARFCELFNERQLLGLELSCQSIAAIRNVRIRHALSTNLSDLLRYQNMLCRYCTMALKSLDVFSIHGFPVGLVQCESNLLGITNGNNASVGSGGWANIIEKYSKAKQYCDEPFEVRQSHPRKTLVPIKGEWIGERLEGKHSRTVSLRCLSATEIQFPEASLDAVFTDPPYFGNVQYGELMDFCYVWLRKLVGSEAEGFSETSTRSVLELTGNTTQLRGLEHFTEGLSTAYQRISKALKPGAPLAFTYHHNKLEAYQAVGVAILDAGLVCTAALPCPAEMGGSIHIHGTDSSIIDTVFVCRCERQALLRRLPSFDQIVEAVCNDLTQLREGGVRPSAGDTRCLLFGHLTRIAIQNLRSEWKADWPLRQRIGKFAEVIVGLGPIDSLLAEIDLVSGPEAAGPLFAHRRKNVVSL
jgi:putative DNA methylase